MKTTEARGLRVCPPRAKAACTRRAPDRDLTARGWGGSTAERRRGTPACMFRSEKFTKNFREKFGFASKDAAGIAGLIER